MPDQAQHANCAKQVPPVGLTTNNSRPENVETKNKDLGSLRLVHVLVATHAACKLCRTIVLGEDASQVLVVIVGLGRLISYIIRRNESMVSEYTGRRNHRHFGNESVPCFQMSCMSKHQ